MTDQTRCSTCMSTDTEFFCLGCVAGAKERIRDQALEEAAELCDEEARRSAVNQEEMAQQRLAVKLAELIRKRAQTVR